MLNGYYPRTKDFDTDGFLDWCKKEFPAVFNNKWTVDLTEKLIEYAVTQQNASKDQAALWIADMMTLDLLTVAKFFDRSSLTQETLNRLYADRLSSAEIPLNMSAEEKDSYIQAVEMMLDYGDGAAIDDKTIALYEQLIKERDKKDTLDNIISSAQARSDKQNQTDMSPVRDVR